MERPLRHLALHRIGATELRIVSDIDAGVIPIVEGEEAVIRGYAGRPAWPHRWVTLFVLRDLQPLVRQAGAGVAAALGGAAALDRRAVVNVYDLADHAGCHVFVNQQVMERAGYWGDALATMGLLAHEHAHPLAETPVVRASRRLSVERTAERREPAGACAGAGLAQRRTAAAGEAASTVPLEELETGGPASWRARLDRRLSLLLETLCVYAPREICANELAIRSGFHEALRHLNRRNIETAARGLGGRQAVVERMQEEVRAGRLPREWGTLVVLIGDMEGYLGMALEVAAFDRAGRGADSRDLTARLEARVRPALDPEAGVAFDALRDRYAGLAADASPDDLTGWANEVTRIIAAPLERRGWDFRYRVVTAA